MRTVVNKKVVDLFSVALLMVLSVFAVQIVRTQIAHADFYIAAITQQPDDPSTNRKGQFGFSTTGGPVECKVDDEEYKICEGDFYQTQILSLGSHTFSVHVVDGTNPESTASYTWTVADSGEIPANTTIDDIFPSSPSADKTPSYSFSSDNPGYSQFECALDDEAYVGCYSPYTLPEITSSGWHTFHVRAVLFNTNVPDPTPASFVWTVDAAASDVEVNSCADLAGLSDLEASYVLTQDIDCSGEELTPIGTEASPFKGKLSGNGYSIANMNLTGDNDNCGLFGYLLGAEVTELHISGANLTCDDSEYAGVITGHAFDSNLGDSIITDSVIAGSNATNAGGLIGYAQGFYSEGVSITNSYADTIISTGTAGGLVGFSATDNMVIQDSYTTGTLDCSTCGGMIGSNMRGLDITSSYTNMDLGNSGNQVGGFVGYLIFGQFHLTDSFSTSVVGQDVSGANGVVGQTNSASFSPSNVYFDSNNISSTSCDDGGTLSDCTAVSDSDYFMSSESPNAPIDTWDQAVWNIHNDGELPSFRVGSAMCDSPLSTTESSYDLTCVFQREMKHQYTGQVQGLTARYKVEGSSADWKYQTWNKNTGHVILCGLQASSHYVAQLHAQYDMYSSDWANEFVEFDTQAASPVTDRDNDGVADSGEACGPNEGDANNDESYDREQANIASIKSAISGKQVVLESTCSGTDGVVMQTESSSSKDAAFDYSQGLMDFTLTGCGTTATVTQYYFGSFDPAKLVLRKYNPNTHSYNSVTGALLSSVTIGGQAALKVVYQVADNGPLDLDPANGTIHDPVGLAAQTVGTPNTGFSR